LKIWVFLIDEFMNLVYFPSACYKINKSPFFGEASASHYFFYLLIDDFYNILHGILRIFLWRHCSLIRVHAFIDHVITILIIPSILLIFPVFLLFNLILIILHIFMVLILLYFYLRVLDMIVWRNILKVYLLQILVLLALHLF